MSVKKRVCPLFYKSDGIISRIIGDTGTICFKFIFHSPYNRHYGFSSAVWGKARQRISRRSSMHCIENIIPDFLAVFYGSIFLSAGTYADIYK